MSPAPGRIALKGDPDQRDQRHRLGSRGRGLHRARRSSCSPCRRDSRRQPIAPSVSASASWTNTGISTRGDRLVLPAVRQPVPGSAPAAATAATGSETGETRRCTRSTSAISAMRASASSRVGRHHRPRAVGQRGRARPASRATALRSNTSQKRAIDPILDASTASTAQPSRAERRHAAIGDAARHDQIEIVEIGRDVERKSMAGDPARDAHADRRELFAADPDAGQPCDACRRRHRSRPPRGSGPLRGRARSGARRSDRASGR